MSISLAIGLGVNMGGSPLWSPRVLFAAGEQGAWYDPSDFSTMFQDSAGTTPVTAVGQPVGKILDKSGNGLHAVQATTANRPTLQQDGSGYYYLSFNGTNSGLATASVNFGATSQMTACAGLYKASDAAVGVACELSPNATSNNGAFLVFAPQGAASPNFSYGSRGTAFIQVVNTSYAAPIAAVVTGQSDILAPLVSLRVNGASAGTGASSQGTGPYGNYPLNIGARSNASSSFFNGRLYQLVVRGAASTAAQISQTERYVGSKQGIAL